MAEKKLYEISTHHKVEKPTLEGETLIMCNGGLTFAEMRQVDAVEVVHGHWSFIGEECCVCSVCHKHAIVDYRFCPECGAKMDGDGDG